MQKTEEQNPRKPKPMEHYAFSREKENLFAFDFFTP